VRAAPECLERVPARSAAKIEHPVTWADGKTGEIDSQQGAAPSIAR
jgi:hypothetical protein